MIRTHTTRGFSLIELLIAIFILGIGIISIATLFPAGIAQQQKTANDVIGPIVARNALTLIRSRVEPQDFGGSEQFEARWSPRLCGFSVVADNVNPWPTICGDWMWRRPAIVPADYGNSSDPEALAVRGAIDIFAKQDTEILSGDGPPNVEFWTDQAGVPGLAYNKSRYPDNFADDGTWLSIAPPTFRIFAGERQYPMWTGDPADRPAAQYYWDCMFRRYEGRMLVGIFVYKVVDPSQIGAYMVDTTGLTTPDFPRRINLSTQSSTGPWSAYVGGEILLGSELDDPTEPQAQWQFPGQWLIDQNGNVMQVQNGRRRSNDTDPVRLTTRPIELAVFESIANPDVDGVNVNWWDKTMESSNFSGFVQGGVVTDIWFVPTRDSFGRKIIPVYATVEEL